MKYVALLRGINVGGHNKIKMEDLREMFSTLGFENVKTYIASGNVIFDGRKMNESNLAAKIKRAIEKRFSLNIEVMIRTISEIETLVKQNPFETKMSSDTSLYVVFLKEKLSDENTGNLTSHNNESEEFVVDGRNIFCLSKKGFIKGLLGKKYIDNQLKMPATARNWRTVNKITEF
jgi:uncharacterized protein (DUF1697 family)